MRKLSKIISTILIVCMVSSCIYVNGTAVGSVYANDIEKAIDYIANIECKVSASIEQDKMDVEVTWVLSDGMEPTGYEVILYEDEQYTSEIEGSYKEINGTDTAVEYDGLDKDKTYYVAVKPYKTQDSEIVYGVTEKCVGLNLERPQIEDTSDDGNKITVSFSEIESASAYILSYSVNGTNNEIKTTSTKVEIGNLEENTAYNIKVCAIYSLGEAMCKSEWSDESVVTIEKIAPGVPKMIIEPYNLGATMTWEAVPNATAYEIWRYAYGDWSCVKTVTGLTYTDKGLKNKKGYYYKIRAIREIDDKVLVGEFCDHKAFTAIKCLTGDIRKGYDTGTLKRSSKVFLKGDPTKLASKKKLKRKTKVTIIGTKKVKKKNMAYVKANGKYYWIKRANIKYKAPYTTLDYTVQAKERFVNKQGYSSSTEYLLFISHYTQRIYLFTGSKGNWEHKTTYRCATGKATRRSPQGVFKVTKKGKRTPAGSKYVTYFYKSNAFHARPAGSKTIGKPASNGCIRMYTDSAIYFYKNIPKGTTVVSY